MCLRRRGKPQAYPLSIEKTPYGDKVDFGLVLGKVTEKRNGEHVSSRGMLYPTQQQVWDQHAIPFDHNQCLHLTSNPQNVEGLEGWGSHRLAMLPAPQLWGDPNNTWDNRCWHSDGGFVLGCLECDFDLEDITDPYFAKDMGLSFKKSGDYFYLPVPKSDIWHSSTLVPA